MPSDEARAPQRNVFFTSEFKRNIRQLILQRDFILHCIGTGSVDVTLSPSAALRIHSAKGLATFGNEILHVVQNDMSRC
ncbi:MAG: hypothetical protein MI924_14035, partial [Chloroflexales bacterium]|nr:hypothetical protein [Chloroflexales bacterium]